MCCPFTQNCFSDNSLTTVWRAQAPNTNELCWKIAYMTEGMVHNMQWCWCSGGQVSGVGASVSPSMQRRGQARRTARELHFRCGWQLSLSSICSSVQCQYDNTADIMAHNYTQHLSAAPRRAGSGAGAGRWANDDDTRTLDTQTLLWHDCRWHYYVTMVIYLNLIVCTNDQD